MTQGSFFGVGEIEFSPTSPVLAFDPLVRTNSQRVVHLAQLGYLPEPVLDPTYGLGGMWNDHLPRDLVTADADCQRDTQVRCDFTALPFKNDSFQSCIFDPPYKSGGDEEYQRSDVLGGGHDSIANRYGVNTGRKQGVAKLIELGLAECVRVATAFVVVKCQDQIHNNRFQFQTSDVAELAEGHGWRVRDMLHLNNSISQPLGTAQRHARRNYSTFVVLVPSVTATRRIIMR